MYGEKIKFERNRLNLSQEKLAEKLNVQKSSVSNWELNKAQPSYEKLIALAELFGVTTDYLLGYNQNEIDEKKKIEKALCDLGINENDFEYVIKQINMLKEFKENEK